MNAVCHRCGAPKELALARCGACGVLPVGREREDALLCSTLFVAELDALQARLRRGEPLQPSSALREEARARLAFGDPAGLTLTPAQMGLLALGNLLVTPALGWAAWYRWRLRPGHAGRQALVVTIPVTVGMTLALLAWRFGGAGS